MTNKKEYPQENRSSKTSWGQAYDRNAKKGWKCARRVAHLARKCKIYIFWTFTFYKEISNKEKKIYWKRFLSRLRKKYPRCTFYRVIEEHKSGQWHYHAIFDRRLEWADVERMWRECGAGLVVHFKELKNAACVAYYISKYITKSLDSGLHHCYSSSPSFCIHTSDFLKWIWKLIDLKLWKEVKNIFDYFDFEAYALVCGKYKKRRIRVLLQYREWGFSW